MTITTCVFDAYGTLFDVAGAVRVTATETGDPRLATLWPAIAADWRQRQLDYTWLRAAARRHADFDRVTADSLDVTLAAHGLDNPDLRDRMLALWRELPIYPEVPDALAALRSAGLNLAVLSNGTPAMINDAAVNAGIADAFDALISVETAGAYKPHPHAYALVESRFGIAPRQVMFVSGNGWDAAGAAAFGFYSVWINRTAAPRERLWSDPRHELPDLSGLAGLL